MIKLTLDNMVDVLMELIPEFQKYKDFDADYLNDKDLKYLLLGIFGKFLRDRVEFFTINDLIIQKVFKFLNEQFNESESEKEALDYLGIEIFEDLSFNEKGIKTSRELLKGKALESFNETAKDRNRIIGDGGAADALRYELKTKKLLGGKSHRIKVKKSIDIMKKILQNQKLSDNDRLIAQQILGDLNDALEGGGL